jgi:hypothetical protein
MESTSANSKSQNLKKSNKKREITYSGIRTTCLGCLENQPNQLAHMDEGGCLADK